MWPVVWHVITCNHMLVTCMFRCPSSWHIWQTTLKIVFLHSYSFIFSNSSLAGRNYNCLLTDLWTLARRTFPCFLRTRFLFGLCVGLHCQHFPYRVHMYRVPARISVTWMYGPLEGIALVSLKLWSLGPRNQAALHYTCTCSNIQTSPQVHSQQKTMRRSSSSVMRLFTWRESTGKNLVHACMCLHVHACRYMDQFPYPLHTRHILFEKSATYFTHPKAAERWVWHVMTEKWVWHYVLW